MEEFNNIQELQKANYDSQERILKLQNYVCALQLGISAPPEQPQQQTTEPKKSSCCTIL